jgi:hypothetical protein
VQPRPRALEVVLFKQEILSYLPSDPMGNQSSLGDFDFVLEEHLKWEDFLE